MQNKTATLIGATGLIGSHLLSLLQEDPGYKTIRVLVRKPVSIIHPKVELVKIDFADNEAFKSAIAGSDVVYCAVGTTQKKVKGDLVAYRKVDYDIPVDAARFCNETGCQQLLLVSSVGANSTGGNFYIKLKGEVEEKVKSLGLPSVSVFRPSVLLGKRNESRPAEKLAQVLMKSLSFLFPSKYKPIEAHDVAKAMIAAARKNAPGFTVYHFKEMINDL